MQRNKTDVRHQINIRQKVIRNQLSAAENSEKAKCGVQAANHPGRMGFTLRHHTEPAFRDIRTPAERDQLHQQILFQSPLNLLVALLFRFGIRLLFVKPVAQITRGEIDELVMLLALKRADDAAFADAQIAGHGDVAEGIAVFAADDPVQPFDIRFHALDVIRGRKGFEMILLQPNHPVRLFSTL